MLIYYKNREVEGFAEQLDRPAGFAGQWPVINRDNKEVALNPMLTIIREATVLERLAFESGKEARDVNQIPG